MMRNVKRSSRVSARDVRAELAPQPSWVEPQLCRLVTAVPTGDQWAHEIKFDGYRMHGRIAQKQAVLLTRNGLDWTDKYPAIATALGSVKCGQAYLDGELCAVQPDGVTSFAALQGHGHVSADLVYFAFDLLHLDGEDLTGRSLLERSWKSYWVARRRIPASAVKRSIIARAFTRKPPSVVSKEWCRRRSTRPTCRAIAAFG